MILVAVFGQNGSDSMACRLDSLYAGLSDTLFEFARITLCLGGLATNRGAFW